MLLFSGCTQESQTELNTYNLKLTYLEDEQTLYGDMRVEYHNNTETPLDNVCFHLYPNAFREGSQQSVVSLANYNRAYYDGISYGDIEILSANYEYEFVGEDENILKVILSEELEPFESINIRIEFETQLALINHRLGVGQNTINFGNFYPMLCVFENGDFDMNGYHSNGDPFYSEVSNYEVELTFPKEYVCASSGEQCENSVLDGNNILKIKADKIRDFAFVLSKGFKKLSSVIEDTTINYFYYADKTPKNSLKTSELALKTFNSKFGDYPYAQLSVVEASFVHGGMEFPNLVLISDMLDGEEVYANVIVHEIAHQWWYGVVGNNQFDYGWLDEGLAEFSTALFYEANPNYNVTKDDMVLKNQNNYKIFEKVYTNVVGGIDTSFNRPLNEYGSEQEYVYTAYVKAFLMHDSLYELIGAKKYEKCLKTYYKENALKIARPENLIECFERVSSRNLETFFDSWLNGKVRVE